MTQKADRYNHYEKLFNIPEEDRIDTTQLPKMNKEF